jgi:hypothetical protein
MNVNLRQMDRSGFEKLQMREADWNVIRDRHPQQPLSLSLQ